MGILATIGIVILLVIVLSMMSLAGWVLVPIRFIMSLFFDGVGNCLGCFFKVLAYIFLFLVFLAMLAEL